ATDQPRMVIYGEGGIDLRLSLWDQPSTSAMGRAYQQKKSWATHEEAETRLTETSFGGAYAVQADTAYDDKGADPVRVMQLSVMTDDGRLYELRVDMPKGTAAEKEGMALYKAARDRLVIGKE
ncbi:serine/threonine protein kinase, partial [Streptomyces sp. S3(2020)]|nr:serine/threonine protein kinase [Streptomyces sp. S3(2020)]